MGDMADWINDDTPWDGMGPDPVERAERAVIEAARAVPQMYEEVVAHPDVLTDQTLNWLAKELAAVKEAIEALDAAEKEVEA